MATKKLVIDLGITYDAYKAGVLPAWIKERRPLSPRVPVPEEFKSGNILVAVRYEPDFNPDDSVWVYVGFLGAATVEAETKRLCFDYYAGMRPVRCGVAGDEIPVLPSEGFAWISAEAFERVVREGSRRVVRLDPELDSTIPGYAAEHGMTEDQVVEQALREFFTAHEWTA